MGYKTRKERKRRRKNAYLHVLRGGGGLCKYSNETDSVRRAIWQRANGFPFGKVRMDKHLIMYLRYEFSNSPESRVDPVAIIFEKRFFHVIFFSTTLSAF